MKLDMAAAYRREADVGNRYEHPLATNQFNILLQKDSRQANLL